MDLDSYSIGTKRATFNSMKNVIFIINCDMKVEKTIPIADLIAYRI